MTKTMISMLFLVLGLTGIQAAAQELKSEAGVRGAKKSTVTAREHQVNTSTLNERGLTVVKNPTDNIADADISVFDQEGIEFVRETLQIEPGSEVHISLTEIFPDLAPDQVSEAKLQVSVRPSAEGPSTESLQLPVAFFSQMDPRWKNTRLGTCTGYTIGTGGCAISAIAMAGARSVYNMNPASLNSYLTAMGGYSGGCNVIWANAANIDGTSGFAYIGSSTVKSATNLKSILDGNKFPVVKSARFSSHYGVIIGYRNQGTSLSDFYYLDPADPTAVFRNVGDRFVSTTSAIRIYK